ncbi:MAG: PDZ domain-containing protein [Bacteroidetes bacterium]|nr:PDZ domain-containing protein [Bacteroidota bacterium]
MTYLEPGYYAVVGVFGVHKNAVKFTEYVKKSGEAETTHAFYPPKGFFYVQIGKYESYQKARVYALSARKKNGLDSTWVFKAMPYTLPDGRQIGAGVAMDKGIGIDYDVVLDTTQVTKVVKGGPSDKEGVKSGDRIIEVDGENIAGIGITKPEVSERILGVGGSTVSITVLRDGAEQEISIERGNIEEMEETGQKADEISDNKFAGIGILFDIRQDTARVTKVMENGPSSALGFIPGDRIIRINGENIAGEGITEKEISELLSGEEGSFVTISIIGDEGENEFNIQRKIPVIENLIIETERPQVFINKEEEEIEGLKFYFNTYRENNFKEIPGKIEIINPDKPQRIAFKNAHKLVGIPEGFNRSGNVELICEIFGYKKVQHDFNLNDLNNEKTAPFLSEQDDVLVVDFELKRYTKGDLVTMYNVYFFKDAAIIRPESKYELQQLLELLKENEDYKIKILGHTNGNNSGPIIEIAEGSNQYFSNSSGKREGWGSAKKLSTKRAELIRDYLTFEGINPERIEAKGYGGKRSIYEKFDKLAYKNVRVEIEILED